MQSNCLVLEERQRVEGTRMQRSCLELEERRRVEGTRTQGSCLKLEERRRVEGKGCREVAKSKKEREEELREQGCSRVA